VALHNVAAEASIGFHWQLKIDERAFVNAGERCADPCFRSEVGAEGSGLHIESGEADAADRDAVSGGEFFRRVLGGDRDSAIFGPLLDICDSSYFFDNAREHKCLRY